MIPVATTGTRIFLFTGATDMRKSFNGLSGLVSQHFDVELLSGHLFLFFNRKRDCVKIMSWDRDGLAIYRQLYDIEDRGRGLSPADRLELRRRESVPLLEQFKQWLDEQRADPKVLPKSAIGGAVRYALNQWKPLMAFTTDGRLPIDNNATERDLRRLTIGRKNWLFVGSPVAGGVAATMITLVSSAARHNLDIWAYLNDVLRRLAAGDADLDALLPDRWAKDHPESVRVYRQAEQAARKARTKERRARRRQQARPG